MSHSGYLHEEKCPTASKLLKNISSQKQRIFACSWPFSPVKWPPCIQEALNYRPIPFFYLVLEAPEKQRGLRRNSRLLYGSTYYLDKDFLFLSAEPALFGKSVEGLSKQNEGGDIMPIG